MRFVIITGMSGAGKSQAMRFLEDLGYFCVDNLPPLLIPKFAEVCYRSGNVQKAALAIDSRGGKFFEDFFQGLTELKNSGYSYEILFLDASDEVLIKRFKETRRKHPLVEDGDVIKGIKMERDIVMHVKEKADTIIDTSNLLTRQLKEEIVSIFVEGNIHANLIINVRSFGFKYGIPIDSDLVFDVRFLPNPYYIDDLRAKTGQEVEVQNYVMESKEAHEFLEKVFDLVEFLIPNYIKEGKNELVISIGCTGGKHRSVTLANALYKRLKEKEHRVLVDHKDIDKDNKRTL